jgi:hypothetical protein
MSRLGGVFSFKLNAKLYQAGEGAFTFSLGGIKREAKLSSSGVAGFIAKPLVPYIEGELILSKELEIQDLKDAENVTVALELYNGKTFMLREAFFVGEGEASTDGTIKIRFEGKTGEIFNG